MTGQTVILRRQEQRRLAKQLIDAAPVDAVVSIKAATRSDKQNRKIHAICRDLAKSKITWAGKRRTLYQWKALLVSGHAVATGGQGEIVPGLEGEFVAIRESTASMSVSRAASLIEYALAWGNQRGIHWSDEARAA